MPHSRGHQHHTRVLPQDAEAPGEEEGSGRGVEKKKPDIARSEGVVEEPRPKGARLPGDAATERPR
jgi:hypothetical protein